MTPSDIQQPCEWVRDRIDAYLDRALESGDASSVARHVATCTDCARELRLAEHTVLSLQALPPVPCSPATVAAIRRTIDARATAEHPGWQRGRWSVAFKFAAAAALIGLIALSSVSRKDRTDESQAGLEAQRAAECFALINRVTEGVVWQAILNFPAETPLIRALKVALQMPASQQSKGAKNES